MTLSAGISFLPGLYGHDIGGFAGKHHPSPELLVRWCQQVRAFHADILNLADSPNRELGTPALPCTAGRKSQLHYGCTMVLK